MDRIRLGWFGQSIFGRRAGFQGVVRWGKAHCYQNMRYDLRLIIVCVEDAIALRRNARPAGSRGLLCYHV